MPKQLTEEQQDFWDALRSPIEHWCGNCKHWKDGMGCNAIAYGVMNKCRDHTRWEWHKQPNGLNPYSGLPDNQVPEKSYWKWDGKTD